MEVEVEDIDIAGGDGDSSSGLWRKSKPSTSVPLRPHMDEERVSDSLEEPEYDDDEPEILETSSFKPKVVRNPLHARQPEFIDLTNEEDCQYVDQEMNSDLDDSDDVIVEEADAQNLQGDYEDDDDMPELVEVTPLSKKE